MYKIIGTPRKSLSSYKNIKVVGHLGKESKKKKDFDCKISFDTRLYTYLVDIFSCSYVPFK